MSTCCKLRSTTSSRSSSRDEENGIAGGGSGKGGLRSYFHTELSVGKLKNIVRAIALRHSPSISEIVEVRLLFLSS